jgi:FkbM family methyltransferase
MRTAHKIAGARLAYNCISLARGFVGKTDKVIAKRRGIVWELDLAEGIDLSIFLFGAYEWHTINQYKTLLKPGSFVVDVGANIGSHTLPLAKMVGDEGKVIAFEPTDFAFCKLMRNVTLNPSLAGRIELQQAMITATRDDPLKTDIYSSWPLTKADDLHGQHLGRLKTTAGAVALTLDDALANHDLGKLDLIKIDVDGNEHDVLSGATKTLEKFKPAIVMELAPYLYRSEDFEDMIFLLRGLGACVLDVTRRTPLPLEPKTLATAIPEGSSWNVLVRF